MPVVCDLDLNNEQEVSKFIEDGDQNLENDLRPASNFALPVDFAKISNEFSCNIKNDVYDFLNKRGILK